MNNDLKEQDMTYGGDPMFDEVRLILPQVYFMS